MKATWIHPILRQNWDALARWVGDEDRLPEVFRGPRGTLSVEPLGCGHYGCVLRTSTLDVVLKITTDASEAAFVATVLGMANPPYGLVRYHAIVRLPGSYRNQNVYAIWREEAFDVGEVPSLELQSRRDFDGASARMFVRRLMAFKVAAAEARKYLSAVKDPVDVLRASEGYAREAYERAAVRFADDGSLGSSHYAGSGEAMDAALRFSRWTRGPQRVAMCIALCRLQAEMMHSDPYGAEVGAALEGMLDDGILLADVHTNNLGRVFREGFGSDGMPVITDPGHAYYLRGEPYDLSALPSVTDAGAAWPGIGAGVGTRSNPPDSRARLAAAMRAVGEPA